MYLHLVYHTKQGVHPSIGVGIFLARVELCEALFEFTLELATEVVAEEALFYFCKKIIHYGVIIDLQAYKTSHALA